MMDSSKCSIGIGNYKGVMLCNRPFGGTEAPSRQTGISESNAFSCGVVADAPGTNVTISSKEKHKMERPKKDSVISKHRKWLADLQKQKDFLESQQIFEMAQKKEVQMKFTDHESKQRKLTNAINNEEYGAKSAESFSLFDNHCSDQSKLNDRNENESRAESQTLGKATSSDFASQAKVTTPQSHTQVKFNSNAGAATASSGNSNSNNNSNRPAWALTKSAADTADEEKIQDDEDDLLSFAEGLDFDRYIGDMEVRTMMDGLRHRIAQMEKELALEEKREGASEERAVKREQLAMMIDDANLIGAQQEEKSQREKDIIAAHAVLQSDEGSELSAVHSSKSVTAMIKKSRDKILNDALETRVLHHPIIVVHQDDGGARLRKNSAISNLPYMRRNPAV